MTTQLVQIKPAARSLTLTPEAVEKVAVLLKSEESQVALRVGVRPGGCSGFSYELFFDEEREEADTVSEYTAADGSVVTVLIDPQSDEMLKGASLTYEDGLGGKGFKIDNPNAQRTCGCGNSFA